MALKATKRVEPSWYTPEDERDEESPARFKVRALTTTEQIDVLATFVNGAPGAATYKACFRLAVMEIEQVTSDSGKPITNTYQFLLQPNFRDVVVEVGAEVFSKSFLTEEEEKNSSLQ